MAIRTLSDTASGWPYISLLIILTFWIQSALYQSNLAWLTPNLGILRISVCSFWLCGSYLVLFGLKSGNRQTFEPHSSTTSASRSRVERESLGTRMLIFLSSCQRFRKYSESPLLWWSTYFGRPTKIRLSVFVKPVHCPTPLTLLRIENFKNQLSRGAYLFNPHMGVPPPPPIPPPHTYTHHHHHRAPGFFGWVGRLRDETKESGKLQHSRSQSLRNPCPRLWERDWGYSNFCLRHIG